ncbi:hypothetical protein ACFWBI_33395 [Streptomyces sp. NPDC059982]|uniref:hypothetical protein n=1 Tax=Streptomyces sp. NPDC059982 TaxID=3347024 RepID=UPI003689BBB4
MAAAACGGGVVAGAGVGGVRAAVVGGASAAGFGVGVVGAVVLDAARGVFGDAAGGVARGVGGDVRRVGADGGRDRFVLGDFGQGVVGALGDRGEVLLGDAVVVQELVRGLVEVLRPAQRVVRD